ncbi:hypothetical protein QTH89_15985 [Variovorax sp. J22G21]|uniref:hypothetical protein n=1 Tax=Variovorax fucosicus TaxID=3053517 RepID=UPI00257802B7|nr:MULTISPECIES: hypothetical protein [unclassified Variovorax]MDM0037928.1 hypothetical protein [Variovorax sp. J22R193]MDM0062704.1 hypothetical protein [Variovorax sp. J22G21]
MKANEPTLIEEKDIEPWLHLFARIDVTLMSVSGAEAQRIFRALGPHRRANAHQRLLLERRRLILELQDMGVCPIQGGALPAWGSPCEGSPGANYELLAQAFAQCALAADRLGKFALRRWLLDRAHMHRQHALFLST